MPLSRGRKNCLTTKGDTTQARVIGRSCYELTSVAGRSVWGHKPYCDAYKSNLEIAGELGGKMHTLKGQTLPFGVT